MGQNLADILAERMNPIELMLQGGLLDELYANSPFTQCFAQMTQIIRHICFKYPRIRILEIGAGGGSATLPLLRGLSFEELARLGHYDVTDNFAEYLEEAKRLLDDWKTSLSFKPLDIHRDPTQQGFEPESYDVVIAANASQELLNTKDSLANIRLLLKPHGKLMILEKNRPKPFMGLILGMFPGRWQGQQNDNQNKNSVADVLDLELDEHGSRIPRSTRQEWQGLLSKSNFSGVDLTVDDLEGPAQYSTLIVSTAMIKATQRLRRSIGILGDCSKCHGHSGVISTIQYELQSRGFLTKCVPWESDILTDDDHVVIDDKEHLILTNATQARFDKVASLLAHGRRLFWISVTSSLNDVRNPATGLVTGLARTAHAENPALRMMTLDVQEPFFENKSELLSVISRLITDVDSWAADHDDFREREYVYRHKEVMIPRLLPQDMVGQDHGQKRGGVTVYGQQEQLPKAAGEQTTMMSNEIYPSRNSSLEDPASDGDVEIEVKARGVNAEIVALAPGHVEGSTSIMGECAGVIAALGSGVSGLHIGDRVCAVGGEPFATRVRVPGSNAARLPESIPFNVGASVPLTFMTAHYCLSNLLRPGKSQSIMLRGAPGAIERATILVAQRLGFFILVIVSSESERESWIGDFGMLPKCVLLDEPSTLREKVLEQAKPNGVDALLCFDAQALTEEQVACVAPLGSVLQVASPGSQNEGQIRKIPRANNLTLRFVDLRTLIQHQYLDASTLLADVLRSYEKDLIQFGDSIVPRPTGQIANLLKLPKNDLDPGNVVLENGVDSLVDGSVDGPFVVTLDSNATYVIAGGLGDLGQRVSRMMVNRGARHICALSRRTITNDEHQRIEHGLQMISREAKFYCKVCDIANATAVDQCITEITSSNMPVVRGVVQAAVVMHVSPFRGVLLRILLLTYSSKDRTLSNMRLDHFTTPLNAKFHGTHNLFHRFRDHALQFFVILSSVSGVFGMSGQASYAAGSVYQDCVANSGLAPSSACISLDIGLVADTDANTPTTRENFARHGLIPIQWSEVVVALDYAMGSSPSARDTCKQLVVGVDQHALSRAKIVNATSQSPMFCHIRPHAESSSTDDPVTTKQTLRDALADSADPVTLQSIIAAAIARKLQGLISSSDDFDGEQMDFSVTVLGLDSLVITELKNWISLEFGAAVHVSEIFERDSIAALAALVMTRSIPVQEAKKE